MFQKKYFTTIKLSQLYQGLEFSGKTVIYWIEQRLNIIWDITRDT
jgi:hypothetical protein